MIPRALVRSRAEDRTVCPPPRAYYHQAEDDTARVGGSGFFTLYRTLIALVASAALLLLFRRTPPRAPTPVAPTATTSAPASAPLQAAPRFGAAAPSTTQWVTLTGASYGLMATSAGVVYSAHCTVQSITKSEAALYVLLIDTASSSQPHAGTAAINGGVSGGMTAAGNDVTFDDQTYPALTFASGLMVAASTTPDTFTAPNEGDRIRCDAKIRSTNP